MVLQMLSLKRFLPVAALLVLAGCGGGDGPTPPAVTVSAVGITPVTATLVVGETQTLTSTVNGSAGVSQAVTWSTSAPTIATVSQQGVVTGVGPGSATIAAASVADPTKSATVSVLVNAARSVTVTPATVSILTTETRQLTANVVLGAGANTAVTWRSSAPAVATVNGAGLVTGVTPGTATITALAAHATGPGVDGACAARDIRGRDAAGAVVDIERRRVDVAQLDAAGACIDREAAARAGRDHARRGGIEAQVGVHVARLHRADAEVDVQPLAGRHEDADVRPRLGAFAARLHPDAPAVVPPSVAAPRAVVVDAHLGIPRPAPVPSAVVACAVVACAVVARAVGSNTGVDDVAARVHDAQGAASANLADLDAQPVRVAASATNLDDDVRPRAGFDGDVANEIPYRDVVAAEGATIGLGRERRRKRTDERDTGGMHYGALDGWDM